MCVCGYQQKTFSQVKSAQLQASEVISPSLPPNGQSVTLNHDGEYFRCGRFGYRHAIVAIYVSV